DMAEGDSTAAAPTRTRRFLHGVRELVIVVVIALVASALLRAFVLQAFFVPSGSMLPEIQKDDRILVSRINSIERGEIIVFKDPGNWLDAVEQPPPPTGLRKGLEWLGVLPASGHEHLVKRVIGLEGDRIICCEGGQLVINGVSVDESSHLFQKKGPADDQTYDVVVPDDHVFVLGDHRYGSGDSAYHLQDKTAFVPVDLVVGRAFSVIWPVGDAHLMRRPDMYDEVPAGQAPPDEAIVKPLRRTPR
ncbi:MAG: signal peptidase I, partial [Nocardioidaceae bacterium]|nr:signal peptidase I [Nocardioidaceae bacterium]